MALRDIIGQDKAINVLKGCIAQDRIPHALIFAGDEGIGKKLTAFNFAKTLNCMNDGENDLFSSGAEESADTFDVSEIDACDTCQSCTKTEKGIHPDVFMIEPEGEGRQITVNAIRQLEESLSYKPFEGRWKIALIDNADRLNQSAANAFLQTLEEPSEQSILILISSRPDMLLPTIRSRCQRISFPPLPVETMKSLLKEKLDNLDDGQTGLLSTLSGGRLGYALKGDLIGQRDWSFSMFMQMVNNLEADIWEDRESMDEWFDWSQLLLRDIAVYNATEETELLVNQDLTAEIRTLAGCARLADVLKLARDLYNIKRKLAFNLNKQLTFNFVSLMLRKSLGKSVQQ